MKAPELDDAFVALADRLNQIPTTPEESARANASIADWQDFYWSQYEQWPVNDIAKWNTTLGEMTQLVASLAAKYQGQAAPTPEAAKPAKTLANIGVYGDWPLWMKVTAGGLIGLMLYKAARETKVL